MTQTAPQSTAIEQLKVAIRDHAKELGFADCGFSQIAIPDDYQHYRQWLSKQHHGTMHYMENSIDLRRDITKLVPETLSVISVRMDYLSPSSGFSAVLKASEKANISRYALGRDYHKLMRKRLTKLARFVELQSRPIVGRAFVDSAPVLERAYAQQAGLGWIGKNSMLINKQAGSFFFLGELATDLPLGSQPVENNSIDNRSVTPSSTNYGNDDCGNCTACMQLCPTQAIVAPYQVDARRCISYLTIEHQGAIDRSLRPLMGNRIYGCDDCQLVCPWNRYAQASAINDFKPRHKLDDISLLELFSWNETDFLYRFEGSPIRRIGFEKWQRNIAIALGNADYQPSIVDALKDKLSGSTCEMVAEHISWAIEQQLSKKAQPTVDPQQTKRVRAVEKIMVRFDS